MQRSSIQNGDYCHIYNRGVDKRKIFLDKNDYIRFIRSIRGFNQKRPAGSLRQKYQLSKSSNSGPTAPKAVGPLFEPLVEINAYCLNLNHYHLILKQVSDNGVSEFMKRLAGGYTWYFNNKYNRSGSLFQGKYQYSIINDTYRLMWLSAYVNCNYEIHKFGNAINWQWSSYLDYLDKRGGSLCNKKFILSEFSSSKDYINFCKYVIKEAQDIKIAQKYLTNVE